MDVSFEQAPRSCLFVISGPSGTGKTSLICAWLKEERNISSMIKYTTRPLRLGTEAASSIVCVGHKEFKRMIDNDVFADWIKTPYGEYYGTPRGPIDDAIRTGTDMVFDFSPEGLINLRRLYSGYVVGIFVMTPTLREMRIRIRNRGTENRREQQIRYKMALRDFNFVDQHDYHLVNRSLSESLAKLRAIRVAEKTRLIRQQVLDIYAKHAEPARLRYNDD